MMIPKRELKGLFMVNIYNLRGKCVYLLALKEKIEKLKGKSLELITLFYLHKDNSHG